VLQNKPSHWAEVPIGEVLKYLDEQVMFDDMAEYITITVRRRHGGLEAREKLFGHEIKTKKQYRLHRAAFIISRVQCWHAAFAIVPDDIPENMIASQNYDQFEISPKVDSQFFWWLSHSPQFIETVRSSASGVVIEKLVFNRDAWLQKTIPLPPLTEQRRIVAHIESLAARVNEAQRLREETGDEADKLHGSATRKLFTELGEKYHPMPIGKTFDFRNDVIYPTDGKVGKLRFIGLQHVESNTGERIGEDTLYAEKMTGRKFNFSPGEIVYGYLRPYLNKVWIADCEGVCSVDQYVLKPKNKVINTEYLAYFMRSPVFLEKAIELTHNLLLPRLRSGLLSNIPIPVPSLDEQRRIVAYLDGLQAKVNALRELQSASGEELSALMPSILDKAFKGEL
jgi:type I restriction enzyme, S subunit